MRRLRIIALFAAACLAFNSYAQIQTEVEKLGPDTYYKLAKAFFSDKNYNEAIVNFEKTIQFTDSSTGKKIADTSRLYLAAIYTVLGNADLKNDSLDQAIEN